MNISGFLANEIRDCASRGSVPHFRETTTLPFQAYRNRNAVMREWAANQTRDSYYIDFDAVALADGIPAACANNNKHYACHLRSRYAPPESDVNYLREPNLDVSPLGLSTACGNPTST